MGTIKKGILGGFSGTVGTVVGANWRGMDVIRSRPKASGSNPTPLQLLQRKKFAMAIKFQNSVRALQSRLFGTNSGARSRVNMAASYLLKEVIAEQNGVPVILMNKVILTKGDLTGFQNLAVSAGTNQTLEFSWENNSNQMLAGTTDLFCAAVYDDEANEFHLQEGPQTRTAESAVVHLPAALAGKSVFVFAFFENAAKDLACNSVYLGEVELH